MVGEGALAKVSKILKTSGAISPRHIGVASEAAAAALFARFGFDVSVQYGANQPEYDLVVVRKKEMLKVSVKGTQRSGWGLTQSWMRKKNGDYHAVADLWCKQFSERAILCFVQYKGVEPDAMPRVYLATPTEVTDPLKKARNGKGNTTLLERRKWGARAYAAGTEDRIPDE